MPTTLDRLVRGLRNVLRGSGTSSAPDRASARSGSPREPQRQPHPHPARAAYPGDATVLPDTSYSPAPDGKPDPGEIVWTWVPYEEDHTRGKDRPVLIIGREADWLVALPLTSKDHDVDERQERRSGREWVDIGTGDWDGRGRPSEVRVNRLIRVDPHRVRREGAVLPRDHYERVIAAVHEHRR